MMLLRILFATAQLFFSSVDEFLLLSVSSSMPHDGFAMLLSLITIVSHDELLNNSSSRYGCLRQDSRGAAAHASRPLLTLACDILGT